MSTPNPSGALLARLQALHLAAHPLGLTMAQAQSAQQRLGSGAALGAAVQPAPAGSVVAALLEQARPTDEVAAVGGMLAVLGETAVHERRLRGAGGYPAMVAAAVALAGVSVWGVALPQTHLLRALPGSQGDTGLGAWPWALALLSVTALAAMALGLAGRLRLPLSSRALDGLDALRAWDAALQLHRAGSTLEAALRASALWLSGEVRERRLRFAEGLKAGGGWTEEGPGAVHERLLASGAQRGVGQAVLEALVAQERAELQRAVPVAAQRAQWVALAIGALALLAVAATLFHDYAGAVAGPGGL